MTLEAEAGSEDKAGRYNRGRKRRRKLEEKAEVGEEDGRQKTTTKLQKTQLANKTKLTIEDPNTPAKIVHKCDVPVRQTTVCGTSCPTVECLRFSKANTTYRRRQHCESLIQINTNTPEKATKNRKTNSEDQETETKLRRSRSNSPEQINNPMK